MDGIINGPREDSEGNKRPEREIAPFEWETIIHSVAKEFKTDWDTVLKWNILYFNHRCKFMRHNTREMLRKTKQNPKFTPR